MTAAAVLRRDRSAHAYDPALAPQATVEPGTRVTFETADARGGGLLAHPAGRMFALPAAPAAGANPLTGPLAVRGAQPGDTLLVTVEAIEPAPTGFCGAFAGGLPASGQNGAPSARAYDIADGLVRIADRATIAAAPMVGCAGTAADGAPGSLLAGRFGGNLDHPPLTAGALLHLPVLQPGGLLFLGDVHAAQGDGELSGFGLETAARVTVTVDLRRSAAIDWPWLETAERIMILTAGPSFESARDAAVAGMVAALRAQHGLGAAEALALISLAGDLRIGQAFGGPQTTLRLELPVSLGLWPQ